jgi:hypothetical protein
MVLHCLLNLHAFLLVKEKTINHEDDRFRNYMRLINLRNDYIHANLIRALELKDTDFTGTMFNKQVAHGYFIMSVAAMLSMKIT